MRRYDIDITAKLQRIISIEANSLTEAIQKTNELIISERLVLNSDDFVSCDVSQYQADKYKEE